MHVCGGGGLQVAHMKDKLGDDAASNGDAMRATDLRDAWRRADFYVEATDGVYRKWRPQLQDMYKDRVDWKDVGARDFSFVFFSL
jgi:hypothetical protein